jgi:hypothetical protein
MAVICRSPGGGGLQAGRSFPVHNPHYSRAEEGSKCVGSCLSRQLSRQGSGHLFADVCAGRVQKAAPPPLASRGELGASLEFVLQLLAYQKVRQRRRINKRVEEVCKFLAFVLITS